MLSYHRSYPNVRVYGTILAPKEGKEKKGKGQAKKKKKKGEI